MKIRIQCNKFVSKYDLDHSKGSHGMPGLYFKYDVSALKVIVKPDQEGFMSFLIRISSVIAGIIVISGNIQTIYHTKNYSLKKKLNSKSSRPMFFLFV